MAETAEVETVRRAIVASLFSSNAKGSAGQTGQSYISHCKTWEDIPGSAGERKPRYILLSVAGSGEVLLHKSKRNTNGTFSIGKTWDLNELRSIEIADELSFRIGLGARSYVWLTESSTERTAFLRKAILSFRQYTQGGLPSIKGLKVDLRDSSPVYTIPASASEPRNHTDLRSNGSNQSFPPASNSINGRVSPAQPARTNEYLPSQNTGGRSTPGAQPPPPASSSSRYGADPRNAPPPPPSSTFSVQSSTFSAPSTYGAPSTFSASSTYGAQEPRIRKPMERDPSNTGPPPRRPTTPASSIDNMRSHTPSGDHSSARRPSAPSLDGSMSASRPRTPTANGNFPRPGSSMSKSSQQGQTSPPRGPLRPLQTPNGRPGLTKRMSQDSVASAATGTSYTRDVTDNGSISMGNGSRLRPTPESRDESTPSTPTRRKQSSASQHLPSPLPQSQPPQPATINQPPPSSQPSKPPPPPAQPPQPNQTSPGKSTAPASTDAKGKMKAVEPTIVDAPDTQDILNNVEEMLEGLEWRSGAGASGATGGAAVVADQIESRLLSELQALEAAEIHAIIENDDRVEVIVKHLDEAMAELERMDLMLTLYKTQLSSVAEDITHIEGQNRGLQVQTSNQRALLQEIEELMQTIRIPQDDLDTLAKESLDSQNGITKLEGAAATMYKALLSTREGNVAAAAERGEEYRKKAQQFGKRLYEFLLVMFKYQAELIASDKSNAITKESLSLPRHTTLEKYLERYCGLTLFVKEMDENRYRQICAAYYATVAELHKAEINTLFSILRVLVRRATEDELESTFVAAVNTPPGRPGGFRKVAGSIRSPSDKREKDGNMGGGEAFGRAIAQIIPQLIQEQGFVADFLHLQSLDNAITFADYMCLEGYFKRSARTQAVKNVEREKDIGSVMDLVFGFLPAEVKQLHDMLLEKDQLQIVSILAALDAALARGDAQGNEYISKILSMQQRRTSSIFERMIKDQLKAIEQTKLTVKKRKGVVPFIHVFPDFVHRIENQLVDVETEAPMRTTISDVYTQIVKAMFEALQTMARSDEVDAAASQEDKDKDRLNFYTLIIENMNHFVTTVSKMKVPTLKFAVDQAKSRYDESLNAYMNLILRRPFSRLMDHFHGIEQLLRTTPPGEISIHSQFTKSALKRIVGSMDKRDLKKAVEALSKRVDKHFSDLANPSAENAVILDTVWKACEAEVMSLTTTWIGMISKCYASDGVSLEYTRDDVGAAFAKYRPEQ